MRALAWFTTLGQSATAKVSAMYSAVTGWLGRLPGAAGRVMGLLYSAVVGRFSNAGSWLTSAGARIIGGLIDGIRSKVGELRGLLNSVTGWIPDWKGPIDRDKKLLVPAGRNIMGGLMDGIGSQLPTLQLQLAGVTGAIPAAMPRSQAVAGAVGSVPAQRGGHTFNVTIHAGIGADGKRIGREFMLAVERGLDDLRRERRR